jgi:hypothetical protein
VARNIQIIRKRNNFVAVFSFFLNHIRVPLLDSFTMGKYSVDLGNDAKYASIASLHVSSNLV